MTEKGAIPPQTPHWAEYIPGRQLEILHFPKEGVDVALNRWMEFSSYGSRLAEEWRHGLPNSWVTSSEGKGNTAIGEVDGHQFFAKQRRLTDSPETLHIMRTTDELDPYLPGGGRPEIYAYNSILNELHIAPAVATVLNSPEVQQVVAASGFAGIRLAEPLMGVIDRKREDQKWVIYDYVPDATPLSSASTYGLIENDYAALIKMLREHFLDVGITPNDFYDRQLLVDVNLNLFLIDIEGFVVTAKLHEHSRT